MDTTKLASLVLVEWENTTKKLAALNKLVVLLGTSPGERQKLAGILDTMTNDAYAALGY